MDRLTSMAVFVKAVDLGSFAAAADALSLSAPMVGKHVRFLEARLGARLLNRTTRRQSLTDFGRAYYERCRVVLAEAEAADALAAEQRSEPQGRLRVAMSVHFGRRCVTPVLLGLTRRYPKLELDLFYSDRLIDLTEGEHDLAIRTGALEDSAGLTARRVAQAAHGGLRRAAYLKQKGKAEAG
jgi:DNA-binding transcriptional LysR family regulator